MRSDKLITGLVLVLIGAAFLLNNYGYIDFHWGNIFRLWPIFLVMAGVNMVLANNREAWATGVKILVVIGGFALILFADTGKRNYFWLPRDFQYHDDDNDNDEYRDKHGIVKIEGNSTYNEPYTADTKVASLNISGGGTSYILNDTTSQLFNAQTKEFNGRYEFSNTKKDSSAVLNFNMRDKKGRKGFHWDGDNNNSATIKLNANPVWDIKVQTGAAELDFDLTKFKVKALKLSGGAASFNVKLGQPLAETHVTVETGVSEIHIKVPKDAACSVTTDSGLSSNSINGLTKVSDNHYETPGFAAAKTKIYIKMNGGISDFNVDRY